MREQPTTRRDFQRLADLRAREAGLLVRARSLSGAFYLAGYAVECALKARIAKYTRKHEFPPKKKFVNDAYSHDLESLLRLSGLQSDLERDMKANAQLAANWMTVKDWKAESRYTPSGLKGRDLVNAIVGQDGVLPWIKQRW